MNRKLIFVLFLVFVVLFSFGCKKQDTFEEPAEESQEPSTELQTLAVGNYPGNSFPVEDYVKADCGGEICSVYERTSTWAKVIKIEGRTLSLDTSYEQFQVDVPDNVRYTKVTYSFDSEIGIIMSSVEPISGDHFDEISVGDLITIIYTVNPDKTLDLTFISVVEVEEVLN